MSGPDSESALEPVILDDVLAGSTSAPSRDRPSNGSPAREPASRVLASALALSRITRRPLVTSDWWSPRHAALLRAMEPFFRSTPSSEPTGSRGRTWIPLQRREQVLEVADDDFGLVGDALILPLALGPETTTLRLLRSHTTESSTHLGFFEIALVLLPLLRNFGISVDVAPSSTHDGGVVLSIYPAPRIASANVMSRGVLREVQVLSLVASMGQGFAGRLEDCARQRLRQRGIEAEGRVLPLVDVASGIGLAVVAGFENSRFVSLSAGEPGRSPEEVADRAVDALTAHLGRRGVLDSTGAERALIVTAVAASEFGAPGAIGASPRPSSFTTSEITPALIDQGRLATAFLGVTVDIQGRMGEEGTVRIRPVAG